MERRDVWMGLKFVGCNAFKLMRFSPLFLYGRSESCACFFLIASESEVGKGRSQLLVSKQGCLRVLTTPVPSYIVESS